MDNTTKTMNRFTFVHSSSVDDSVIRAELTRRGYAKTTDATSSRCWPDPAAARSVTRSATRSMCQLSLSDYINSLLAERGLKLCRTDGGWLGVWPIGARHSHGGRKTGKLACAHDCKICSLPRGR